MKNPDKRKRLEILAKIDQLEKQRCTVCIGATANTLEINCQCTAAVEIRNLGKQYESISQVSRANRIQVLVKQLKKSGITKELYLALREFEMTSKDIQKSTRMNESDFLNWKRENGLIKKTIDEPNQVKAEARRHRRKIDSNLLEIAKRNGIPEHVVCNRIFDKKWDVQRAITTKPRRLKNEVAQWRTVAKENGIGINTFYKRVQNGMPMELAATMKSNQPKKVKI